VRIAYAAELPTPDEVIRSLDGEGRDARRPSSAADAPQANASLSRRSDPPPPVRLPAAPYTAAPAAARELVASQAAAERKPEALLITRFEDLIALAIAQRDLGVKLALERDVRLVRCEDGCLEIRLEHRAATTLVNDLARKLSHWTNRPWIVVVSTEEGQPTVKEQDDARKAELKTGVRGDPLVQAVLARFPGAEIVDVRKGEAVMSQPSAAGDPGEEAPEPLSDEVDFDARSARTALPGHDDA
jgi:DNA polymerase-3 subunit gamma/tau